jgi:hypothetical protein
MNGEVNEIAVRCILVHALTCRKILHGADGFTSPPKGGVLRILTALKNPSPQLGLNPQTLDPMASTLTITPPRTTSTVITDKLTYQASHMCEMSIFSTFRTHRLNSVSDVWHLS